MAEEIVFGHDKVTAGASSDIQFASGLARRYVSQWGLSEKIGPILVGENETEVFLGRDFGSRRVVSERTAELVDEEVKRVIGVAYDRATVVLTENRDLLDRIAAALLDRETLSREDFLTLQRGEELPPRPPVVLASTGTTPPAPTPVVEPKRVPPMLGGPEPSPA